MLVLFDLIEILAYKTMNKIKFCRKQFNETNDLLDIFFLHHYLLKMFWLFLDVKHIEDFQGILIELELFHQLFLYVYLLDYH